MTTAHSASPQRLNRRRLTLVLAVIGAMITSAIVIGFALRAEAATQTISGTVTWGRTTVDAGDTLRLDPTKNTTLIMNGTLEVRGLLQMRPNPGVTHVIEFRGNENNFAGGTIGEVPAIVTSDVGLWVLGAGRLDIQGENKPAWDYTWHSSWNGDEVRATPNTPGNYTSFPQVTGTQPANALGYRPELLNLTRNVVIRGTTSNYTHVFINSSQPSTIKNALLRYVSPDFGSDDITGRYGIHFHHAHDGSRGSVVDGVVIRDAKGHAFVPHMSNGITFRNVIAFNVRSEAFWWDEGDSSDDIIFDRAVAAGVRRAVNGDNHHRLGVFYLGLGDNVSVTNSVVVGMLRENAENRSAYLWPEDDEATWFFRGNRAHNNEVNGIFVWQNNSFPHIIEDFTAYYNEQAGVSHGAYENAYVYNGLTLLGNGTAVVSQALGEANEIADTQIWANIKTNGGTLRIDEHALEGETPVRFLNCDFGRVEVDEDGGQRGEYDFINCGLEPNDFDLSGARSDSVFRVQRANGTAFRITGTGTVTSIGKFYNGAPIPGGGSPPGGGGGVFSDVNGHTHQTGIEWLAEQGITQGCNPPDNTRFCPNDRVTRGQMAAFLARALELSNVDDDYFGDDEGSTFETAINRIATAGITSGCNPPSNSRYCPDGHVTRGQMAAFLARAFGYTNSGQGDYFDDDDDSVFEDAIDKLRVAGVTLGCNPPENDEYCPNDHVTRGQMATFLRRAMTG